MIAESRLQRLCESEFLTVSNKQGQTERFPIDATSRGSIHSQLNLSTAVSLPAKFDLLDVFFERRNGGWGLLALVRPFVRMLF